jgi:hydroxymethylglutaryl-CoA lyase
VSETVLITETLRDAWQGLETVVPTEAKTAFIQRLVDHGFHSLDVGSFVNPKLVPAMADSGRVLDGVKASGEVTFTALVANERGLDRLLDVDAIGEVLYPFSLSESFQQRNTNRGRFEALEGLSLITTRAHEAGRTVYATISMAFGNNEGDPFDPAELAVWMSRLDAVGVDRIGLADTTAQADPATLTAVLGVVAAAYDGPLPGLHLHATPQEAPALIDAAFDAGCRVFDSALGGLGGCQFAKGPESNLSTRMLAERAAARGLAVDLPLTALPDLDVAARKLAQGVRAT